MTNETYTISRTIEIRQSIPNGVFFPICNGCRMKSYSGNSKSDVITRLQSDGGYTVIRDKITERDILNTLRGF